MITVYASKKSELELAVESASVESAEFRENLEQLEELRVIQLH